MVDNELKTSKSSSIQYDSLHQLGSTVETWTYYRQVILYIASWVNFMIEYICRQSFEPRLTWKHSDVNCCIPQPKHSIASPTTDSLPFKVWSHTSHLKQIKITQITQIILQIANLILGLINTNKNKIRIWAYIQR